MWFVSCRDQLLVNFHFWNFEFCASAEAVRITSNISDSSSLHIKSNRWETSGVSSKMNRWTLSSSSRHHSSQTANSDSSLWELQEMGFRIASSPSLFHAEGYRTHVSLINCPNKNSNSRFFLYVSRLLTVTVEVSLFSVSDWNTKFYIYIVTLLFLANS